MKKIISDTMLSDFEIRFFVQTMHAMELHNKRLRIKGFLTNCPAGRLLDHCPAREIRELSMKEREKIIDEMSEDEVESVYKIHEKCFRGRC
jgi:hypothetical protein